MKINGQLKFSIFFRATPSNSSRHTSVLQHTLFENHWFKVYGFNLIVNFPLFSQKNKTEENKY